jgi:hypothetical protein
VNVAEPAHHRGAARGIEQEATIGVVLVVCEYERRTRLAHGFRRYHTRLVQFHAQADGLSVRFLEEDLGGDGPGVGTAQHIMR